MDHPPKIDEIDRRILRALQTNRPELPPGLLVDFVHEAEAAGRLDRVLPALPAQGQVETLWQGGLRLSYRAELRAEGSSRAQQLTRANLAYYQAVTRAAAPLLQLGPLAEDDQDMALLQAALEAAGSRIVGFFPHHAHLVRMAPGLRSTLESLDFVERVEPIGIHAVRATPNDPYYSYQWHFPMIDMPAAWDVSTGSGVVVAILDSNSNPAGVDYPIPGNDDAGRAIALYCDLIARAAIDVAIEKGAIDQATAAALREVIDGFGRWRGAHDEDEA